MPVFLMYSVVARLLVAAEASESVSVARWAELKVEVAKEARRLRGMKNAKGARIQADELERSLK